MILRTLVVDNLAYIALGFLAITILITIGLGSWVLAHMSNKKKAH